MGTTIESSWENERLKEQLTAAQVREAELTAHVERLREAISYVYPIIELAKYEADGAYGKNINHQRVSKAREAYKLLREALAATPAQSLASLRNEVLEEAAKVCDARAIKNEHAAQDCSRNGEHDEVSSLRSAAWQMSVCADAIRDLKEPE